MKIFMHVLFDVIVKNSVKLIGIVMLLSILVQILSRIVAKFLHTIPFPWTDELARGTFIWFCFLGAVLAMRAKAHLGIDYFRSKLGPRGQIINDIVVALVVIFFGAVVAYLGYKLLGVVGRQKSPIMRISMQYLYVSLPISGVLIALQGVEFLCDFLAKLGCGNDDSPAMKG